jgi:citrate synthase
MEYIKNRFYEKASKHVADYNALKKNFSDKIIANVTIGQVLTGMKGVPSLLTETSKLDANEGIRFRGYSISELRAKLPRMHPEGEPLPEGLFYLLLIGEIPEREDVFNLSKDWATRSYELKWYMERAAGNEGKGINSSKERY